MVFKKAKSAEDRFRELVSQRLEDSVVDSKRYLKIFFKLATKVEEAYSTIATVFCRSRQYHEDWRDTYLTTPQNLQVIIDVLQFLDVPFEEDERLKTNVCCFEYFKESAVTPTVVDMSEGNQLGALVFYPFDRQVYRFDISLSFRAKIPQLRSLLKRARESVPEVPEDVYYQLHGFYELFHIYQNPMVHTIGVCEEHNKPRGIKFLEGVVAHLFEETMIKMRCDLQPDLIKVEADTTQTLVLDPAKLKLSDEQVAYLLDPHKEYQEST